MLAFPPFRLDPIDERLWKTDTELRLRRKAFSILGYLARHPRRLVTHDELTRAIWGPVALSDSLLRTHIREIRRVLGPDLIETVVGRGYRFLGEVGDDRERAGGLDEALAVAREDRQRQLVFLAGDAQEPAARLDELIHRAGRLLVARGAGVEQAGDGESFQPVFSALGSAGRAAGGDLVRDALGRHAPMALLQLPALISAAEAVDLGRRVTGASPARLLRELGDAIESLARDRPFALLLDDLQWADRSTVELLALLARRREPSRLLVVGSYRRAALGPEHPLRPLLADLVGIGLATAIPTDDWLPPVPRHACRPDRPSRRLSVSLGEARRTIRPDDSSDRVAQERPAQHRPAGDGRARPPS